ncbi:MAG: MFS transporter [Candidatus Thorarchaeota archaeon]
MNLRSNLHHSYDAYHTSKIARLSILSALNRLTMAFTQIVLPLFVLAIGFDEAFYGFMVAAAGYIQGIVLFPAGMFSDRKGRGLAILLGGLFSGMCLLLIPFTVDSILLLALYGLSGVGTGFTMTSIDSLIADHTRRGDERTRSYGYTTAAAVIAAMFGSFFAGFFLDPIAFPYISPELLRYSILFWMMASFRIGTGVFGLYTERWLSSNSISLGADSEKQDSQDVFLGQEDTTEKQDTETALLFGMTQLLMGISSGMVIPYLIPWIYAAFNPDPIVLGGVPAISNVTLATGTLAVGLFSDRIGKFKTISGLYLLAPILMIGIVYSPWFLAMLVFYVARDAVANMNRPIFNSLFMDEVALSRRARAFSITRVMWQFPRQTGTLLTAILLVYFSGIVEYGTIVFPLAMLMYPISVIPMYIAVKRNEKYRNAREGLSDSDFI